MIHGTSHKAFDKRAVHNRFFVCGICRAGRGTVALKTSGGSDWLRRMIRAYPGTGRPCPCWSHAPLVLRSGDGEVTRRPFFRIALYGAWPWVSTMKPVHDVVDVYLPPEWVGDGRKSGGYN